MAPASAESIRRDCPLHDVRTKEEIDRIVDILSHKRIVKGAQEQGNPGPEPQETTGKQSRSQRHKR
jgi:hypothetical protein